MSEVQTHRLNYEVKMVPIDSIIPYDKNPRDNGEAVPAVMKSIQEFGFRNPIVVDKDNVIVCGHTRREAAIRLGMKEVPVMVADDLDDKKIRAFRIADNQTAAIAEWDDEKLAEELLRLQDEDYDLDMLGFGDQISRYIGGQNEQDGEGATEKDAVPDAAELDEQAASRRGEMYQLGRHRLLCGDATEGGDVARLLQGDSEGPMLWLTDPPYNVAYEGCTEDKMTIDNDHMESAQFREFLTKAFQNVEAFLQPGASFYIFYADAESQNFKGALDDVGLQVRENLVWVKNVLVLSWQTYQYRHEPLLFGWKSGAERKWYSGRDQTTVLEFNKPAANKQHPCLAPDTMVVSAKGYVRIDDLRPGDFVLSADGRFHKIEWMSRHKVDEDIYEIKAVGTNYNDFATGNHPYLVWDKAKKTASFVEAKDLRSGDLLMRVSRDLSDYEPVELEGVKFFLYKVKSCWNVHYNGDVINLSIEGNPTFQTINGMTHNTMKPVDLLSYLLKNSSKRGDIVIDTFGGSGSTLIACESLDRCCRMIEYAPRYCDVIRKRWAEFQHGEGCDWQSLTPKIEEKENNAE